MNGVYVNGTKVKCVGPVGVFSVSPRSQINFPWLGVVDHRTLQAFKVPMQMLVHNYTCFVIAVFFGGYQIYIDLENVQLLEDSDSYKNYF